MYVRDGSSTRSLLLGTALSMALGVLLAACATSGTAGAPSSTPSVGTATTATGASTTATAGSTSPSPSASQGVIAGHVVSGGNCSAMDAATPCPGAPATGYTVRIQAQDGGVVATASTDSTGRFAVAVAPGTYLVQPQENAGKGLYRVIPGGPLTVRAGSTTPVQIILETSGAQP